MSNNFNDPSFQSDLDNTDLVTRNESNAKPDDASSKSPSDKLSQSDLSGQPPEEENFWSELLYIIVLSVSLAFGIRWLIAEARYIPSESMLPTLEINDRLIIEKISYRFHEPRRGDIIVFRPTDSILEAQPGLKDALIKRVIGLPGDTVEFIGGIVYVNNEKMTEYYTYENLRSIYQELPADQKDDANDIINIDPHFCWGPKEVPEGSYLVLGDNRLNSYDGSFWGFVPESKIIGRAAVRIWPPARMGAIDSEDPIFLLEDETVPDDVTCPKP